MTQSNNPQCKHKAYHYHHTSLWAHASAPSVEGIQPWTTHCTRNILTVWPSGPVQWPFGPPLASACLVSPGHLRYRFFQAAFLDVFLKTLPSTAISLVRQGLTHSTLLKLVRRHCKNREDFDHYPRNCIHHLFVRRYL